MSLLEPDIEKVARIIGGTEAEIVAGELHLVHRARGTDRLRGRVLHPLTLEWLDLSDEELDQQPGAAWLVRKRVHRIPRLLGGFPAELFPPPVLRGDGLTGILGVVLDLCSWRVIPAFTADPEGEFDGPIPAGRTLDCESVLAWSGLRYATLAAARRADGHADGLFHAVEVVRGICFYQVRPFLRWLQKGRKGPHWARVDLGDRSRPRRGPC